MKKNTLLFALTILSHFSIGQIVSSSCIAQDEIVEKYRTDADRLALGKFYQYNLAYLDSIEIPKAHSDTVLNALIAVYNSTSLTARDTVVALYDIHTFQRPHLDLISVSADSNLVWMEQLRKGIFPTGVTKIDSLMNLYGLNVKEYQTHSGLLRYHTVIFISDNNYNTLPLSKFLNSLSGVYYAETMRRPGDGNDITAAIHTDHVELIYSVGWGDCPAGCEDRRFWKFKVYYDCSVEYAGSYGSSSVITAIAELHKNSSIEVFPNPFYDYITIEGINTDFDFIIYNQEGKEMVRGESVRNQIQNLNRLPSGQYILHINTKNRLLTYRLLTYRLIKK